MTYPEEDCLQLSGLQHFAFCRRQWALIHLERQWAENLRTSGGACSSIERAHRRLGQRERRGDTLILRDLRGVPPRRSAVSAQCDVVEFHAAPRRASPLAGEEGRWLPYPVEYKRGAAQASPGRRAPAAAPRPCAWRRCCAAPSRRAHSSTARPGGARRCAFTQALRRQVRDTPAEMHQLCPRGATRPKSSRQRLQRLFSERTLPARS
ncbi:MAG: CRISPR-associated protein Cas4 [Oscillibacter sp.]